MEGTEIPNSVVAVERKKRLSWFISERKVAALVNIACGHVEKEAAACI
jgi:hypothetical protein